MGIELNQFIIADNEICHGQPTFKGTRVMVRQVIELLAAGITPKEITEKYFPSLTQEAILSALKYASKVVGEESYVSF